ASRRRSNPGAAKERLDCFVGLWPPRNDGGAIGLLATTVGPLASAQRRRGHRPPRNDGGTAGDPNHHCEPNAKQSSVVIASRRRSNPGAAKARLDCFVGLWPPRNDGGAIGLRAMTAARPATPTIITSRTRSNPQSSLRAEGEAIQGLQKKDWIASSAFGLLAMTAGRSASAQRRWAIGLRAM